MFCACSTAFGEPPNTNVCPVCLGLPGALPVPNRAAVRLGVRAALALGCSINDVSVFERKGYFYPDLPKGYQISQYQRPLATSGALKVNTDVGSQRIGVGRLHLEEDAGKSLHDLVPEHTAIDFNRSGVPLAEIVSEPELRSPEEARAYLTSLKQLLSYLDVSDCNMEEGSLRVDANLSVRRPGEKLGVKQELKNLNSFGGVVKGLSLLRESLLHSLEAGKSVTSQTFAFGEQGLRVMRDKEGSPDYRYFPDPDLPLLKLRESGIDVESERASLPELPWDRRCRFEESYDLTQYAAEVLTSSAKVADYFEAVIGGGADPKEASHWVMESVLADAKKHHGEYRVHPARLAELLSLVSNGKLSKRAGKEVFAALVVGDEAPAEVADRLGVMQVSGGAELHVWVDEILEAFPDHAARYRAGETRLLDFLMGRAMDASGGKANPARLRQALEERLVS